MNIKKMEKEVEINQKALDKKIKGLIKKHKGKYVAFHNGKHIIAPTLKEGLQKGIDSFGEDTGFVLEEVNSATPIFSSLVKI